MRNDSSNNLSKVAHIGGVDSDTEVKVETMDIYRYTIIPSFSSVHPFQSYITKSNYSRYYYMFRTL